MSKYTSVLFLCQDLGNQTLSISLEWQRAGSKPDFYEKRGEILPLLKNKSRPGVLAARPPARDQRRISDILRLHTGVGTGDSRQRPLCYYLVYQPCATLSIPATPMYDRAQEHRHIQKAAREFRRDLKALQKKLGLRTEAELRWFLARSNESKNEPPRPR